MLAERGPEGAALQPRDLGPEAKGAGDQQASQLRRRQRLSSEQAVELLRQHGLSDRRHVRSNEDRHEWRVSGERRRQTKRSHVPMRANVRP